MRVTFSIFSNFHNEFNSLRMLSPVPIYWANCNIATTAKLSTVGHLTETSGFAGAVNCITAGGRLQGNTPGTQIRHRAQKPGKAQGKPGGRWARRQGHICMNE